MAEVQYNIFNLGTKIVRFKLPIEFVDDINQAYDKNSENLKPHNDQLAGKIAEENAINEILTDDMRNTFKNLFQHYLTIVLNGSDWEPVPGQAWINEMKSGEYNPVHYHTSPISEIGLSSVLMLKRPDWYGIESSREEAPANGWLEFIGGDQAPLSRSQVRVDAEVGEFFVFPYTLLHGVYPFNTTDQVRRTLSYNCNLFRKGR